VIGVLGGILGGAFAKLLAFPKISRLPKHWLLRALICGILCSGLTLATHGDTAGSGYEITRKALEASDLNDVHLLFPFYKLATTVLSYLSGMAGGIFSPCLSIGAGIGLTFAKLLHLQNFRACALMGMAAFFSGVVQAPLTAVIIVMEMTDEHILIIPLMVCAFVSQLIGQWLMPIPLYKFLAGKHQEA
jgi:H+/Cl- antiporter ClcA